MSKRKITDTVGMSVYNLVASGYRTSAVAKQFGLSHTMVKNIAKGKHYSVRGVIPIKFRLTNDEKLEIYMAISDGATKADMQRKYHTSVDTINHIISGEKLGLPAINYITGLKDDVVLDIYISVSNGMYQTRAASNNNVSVNTVGKIVNKRAYTDVTGDLPSITTKVKKDVTTIPNGTLGDMLKKLFGG
jgi:predicted transcriptional regulator